MGGCFKDSGGRSCWGGAKVYKSSKSMQLCNNGKAQHFTHKLLQHFESADVQATFGVAYRMYIFRNINFILSLHVSITIWIPALIWNKELFKNAPIYMVKISLFKILPLIYYINCIQFQIISLKLVNSLKSYIICS